MTQESTEADLQGGVFRQELTAYPLRAMFDEAADALGDDGLAEILAERGVTRKSFEDPLGWVSLEFVEWLVATISERSGNPDFVVDAATRSMSAKYIGPIYPLFVALGTPLFTYRQLPKQTSRLNKFARWEIPESTRGSVRLVWVPTPGQAQERTRMLCRFRAAQLNKIPTLFGLTAARVKHPKCMLDGDGTCEYEVTWNEAAPRRHGLIGALSGAAIGAALATSVASSPWYSSALVSLLALGGWALGRVFVLRVDLGERVREIDEHNQALDRVIRSNEQRYAELLEAKTEVDQKVEQRTDELRRTAVQLEATLQQVRELDQAKTKFFANVSHELRTPLTLVLAPLAALAAQGERPANTQKVIETMQRNGMRLLTLINQLLDLAKIDAGKVQLARVPMQLEALVTSVVERFAQAASTRGIALVTRAPATAPVALDTTWMESAISNLVANALRYAVGTVEVRLRDDGDVLALEVEDDGPGIAPGELPLVFERFAQGSDAQTRQGGTGLGLAIVREAARLHGGDASVRSEPGVATVFRVVLPRTREITGAPVDRPSPIADANLALLNTAAFAQDAAGTTHPRGARSLAWEGPSESAPLIVVVEDDDDLRDFIGDVLSARYRVRAAHDGAEALRMIEELHPDGVVSDVVMPTMDGFELCRRLRAQSRTRALPLLLLTAQRDVGRVLEGFEAGADDYLAKPFHARELLARLGVHVGMRQLISEMAHRERLAALGVLASSLAHQIRNPLAAIVSGLPAAWRKLGKNGGTSDQEMFDTMIFSADRIEKLVSDLMDLSRVDRETTGRFKPAGGVRACVNLIDARDPGRVQIDVEIDESVEMDGKSGDMNHVFLNLIDNAVRAADTGGRIKVSATRANDHFVFAVGDSGPGIPPDQVEAIFAPFWTTRPAGQGTGLGLAIARQVVQQHGGNIRVGRSSLGGAQITVTVPIA